MKFLIFFTHCPLLLLSIFQMQYISFNNQIKKIKSVIKMMKIKTYLLVDRVAVW